MQPKRWTSFTAAILLAVQLSGCSYWSISPRPLDEIGDSKNQLRIYTADSSRVEIDYPVTTPDTLYGHVRKVKRLDSASAAEVQLIPLSEVPTLTNSVTIPLAQVGDVYTYQRPNSFVRADSLLSVLSPTHRVIKVDVAGGPGVELTNWYVRQDSLHGVRSAHILPESGWIALPRSDIQKVSQRHSDVLGSIFVGLGLALVAMIPLVGMAAADLGN